MKTKMIAVEKSLRTLGDEELATASGGFLDYQYGVGNVMQKINTATVVNVAAGNLVLGGGISQSGAVFQSNA
jgi:hypothetical protein